MEQRSAAWFQARLGKLTASRMSTAMDFLKTGKESKARYDYKVQIVAERMTDVIAEHFVTPAMRWGIETEPAAKAAYEMEAGDLIAPMGFYDHPSIDYCGASPDGGLPARDDLGPGLIETKCPTTATHINWMLHGAVPPEHKPQMILQCACTGRKWVEFVSYDPRMPEARRLFVRRFVPTAEEIETIEAAARTFLAEVEAMFDAVKEAA